MNLTINSRRVSDLSKISALNQNNQTKTIGDIEYTDRKITLIIKPNEDATNSNQDNSNHSITNALSNAMENLQDLSSKIIEAQSCPLNRKPSNSIELEVLKNSQSPSSLKSNKQKPDLISNDLTSKDSITENDAEYEYYITRYPKSTSQNEMLANGPVTRIENGNCIKDVNNNNIAENETKNLKQNLEIKKELEYFNENTIKTVVEKCFDQLSKNKKLQSPYIYVKNKSGSKNRLSNKNEEDETEDTKKMSVKNSVENNNLLKVENNNETDGRLGSSLSSLTASSNCSSIYDLKQTIVEKEADFINSPTNTILLSGSNEINELYSLKITFV